MARNTLLEFGQSISRSLGVRDDHEVVVRIHGSGVVEVTKLPLGRKRGDKGTSVTHRVEDLLACEDVRDSTSWLDPIIAALPVADLSGPPEKVGYIAKAWILNKLKQLKNNDN